MQLGSMRTAIDLVPCPTQMWAGLFWHLGPIFNHRNEEKWKTRLKNPTSASTPTSAFRRVALLMFSFFFFLNPKKKIVLTKNVATPLQYLRRFPSKRKKRIPLRYFYSILRRVDIFILPVCCLGLRLPAHDIWAQMHQIKQLGHGHDALSILYNVEAACTRLPIMVVNKPLSSQQVKLKQHNVLVRI